MVSISRIRHVKLPVTDVEASARWYRELFELDLRFEFVEQDEVRGVSLIDASGGFQIALRDRRYCANQPDLAGFDVVAFAVDDLAAVQALASRCDTLGGTRTEIMAAGWFGTGMDITDPDGTVLRIICESPDAPVGFVGVVTDDAGFRLYTEPRLDL